MTNETTAEDIREAAEDALEEAGITDITVNVDDFTKEEAAEEAEGGIAGRITIMSGSGPDETTGEVPFGRTIAKLEKDSQSDGENDANNGENSRNEGETNAVPVGKKKENEGRVRAGAGF